MEKKKKKTDDPVSKGPKAETSSGLWKFEIRFSTYLYKWTLELDWSLLLKSKLFSSFSGGSDDKEYACKVGELGVIPGLGSSPGERNDYPLQYSYLENSMNRGAWWARAHGVTKSQP